jgi:hypothetical protein
LTKLPQSRSAPCTQRRNDYVVQPILAAIDVIAAHCDGYSCKCSDTILTTRARTSSDEYRFAVRITPSSQVMGSPGKSGRFSDPVGDYQVTGRANYTFVGFIVRRAYHFGYQLPS